ncbi:MAG TPA: PPK2 family polyphosphate kinase [Nordella sp.]|nr:PPK2 family polyphosphate kinase [Nordella sp.]
MATQFARKFAVEGAKGVSLAKIDPRDESAFGSKEKAKAEIANDAEAINQLQDCLFAEGRRSLLVVLQGMDCSGKDGTVRAVFNTCGPIGVEVTPFKVPSEEERAHDFIWRAHKAAPPKGIIGIFNRSHYEDVLVVKVRKLAKPEDIERRYEEINNFEKLLSDNGTRILKFMLHISKDEQAERLRERVTDPKKHWKFNPSDLEDRKLWPHFMDAYETVLKRCSPAHAPWHVIPSDRNWLRNAAIARIVRETLEDMAPKYPKPDGWDPEKVVIE